MLPFVLNCTDGNVLKLGWVLNVSTFLVQTKLCQVRRAGIKCIKFNKFKLFFTYSLI